MRNYPASLLLGFGSGEGVQTSTPTFTSVVDDESGTTCTLTVAGSGTIQAYYRASGSTTWTTGLTRSGDGTIQQTGLTNNKKYDFYITAEAVGMAESKPSRILQVVITSGGVTEIEEALTSLLKADGDVAAIVGTRVYPAAVYQGADMEAITYQQISGPRDETLDGPSGFVAYSCQINCWAEKYGEARALAAVVRKLLDGYSGTVGSVVIQAVHLEDEGDLPVMPAGKNVARRYAKRLDFTIWHDEITG